jgi:hypothetical protein
MTCGGVVELSDDDASMILLSTASLISRVHFARNYISYSCIQCSRSIHRVMCNLGIWWYSIHL